MDVTYNPRRREKPTLAHRDRSNRPSPQEKTTDGWTATACRGANTKLKD